MNGEGIEMNTDDPFVRAGFSNEEARELWRVYERMPPGMFWDAAQFASCIRQLCDAPKHTMSLSELLEPDEITTLKRWAQ